MQARIYLIMSGVQLYTGTETQVSTPEMAGPSQLSLIHDQVSWNARPVRTGRVWSGHPGLASLLDPGQVFLAEVVHANDIHAQLVVFGDLPGFRRADDLLGDGRAQLLLHRETVQLAFAGSLGEP